MSRKSLDQNFQQGDYVQVVPGVHDDRMPEGRRDGLVVRVAGEKRDQVIVMFHNSAFLKFHKTQLMKLVKVDSFG